MGSVDCHDENQMWVAMMCRLIFGQRISLDLLNAEASRGASRIRPCRYRSSVQDQSR